MPILRFAPIKTEPICLLAHCTTICCLKTALTLAYMSINSEKFHRFSGQGFHDALFSSYHRNTIDPYDKQLIIHKSKPVSQSIFKVVIKEI